MQNANSIICPACNRKVSRDAPQCPSCGQAIAVVIPVPQQERPANPLVTVLLVVGLLMLLVCGGIFTVVVGSFAITAYGPVKRGASIKATEAQIGIFASALDAYQIDTGDYPNTEQGLEALRVQPDEVDGWAGPYLPSPILLDPWGKPYQYEYSGIYNNDVPDIRSLGPDMSDGTEDDIIYLR